MAVVYGKKLVNYAASHHVETRAAVRKEVNAGERRAKANLAEARSSTHWEKIYGPSHLTSVDSGMGAVDGWFSLVAPNAMAIEFGHAPSGVFGPGGSLEHVDSKAPHGLYILTKAAYLGGINFTPGTGRGGKNA